MCLIYLQCVFWQVSMISLTEQYRMNIPLFFPTVDLLTKWHVKYQVSGMLQCDVIYTSLLTECRWSWLFLPSIHWQFQLLEVNTLLFEKVVLNTALFQGLICPTQGRTCFGAFYPWWLDFSVFFGATRIIQISAGIKPVVTSLLLTGSCEVAGWLWLHFL